MKWSLLIIALIFLLVALLPGWPHSRGWSFRPFQTVALVLLGLLILVLLGMA